MIRQASRLDTESLAASRGREGLEELVRRDARLLRRRGTTRHGAALQCPGCQGCVGHHRRAARRGSIGELLDSTVRVVDLGVRRIRYAIRPLCAAIRSTAPSLVLSSESSLNLCCLAAVRTLPRSIRPTIALREVASPSAARKHEPSWQGRLSYRLLLHFYRFADRVITLTDGARRDLVENFSLPPYKVATMHSNAVITPDVAERLADWDGETGRENGLIVSLGRLSPEKNQRLLLEALQADEPCAAVAPGAGRRRSGPGRAGRISCVEHALAQRVTFVGMVSDPFAWLMRAQVAVCSSVYEGLCNAIIEALGCGTPVVSTDCPFGPREILQFGRYGTLVPADDPAALASAIEAALDRPVERAALRQRAMDYTAERAADDFLDIVAEL